MNSLDAQVAHRLHDMVDGEFDSAPPTQVLLCRGAQARRRRTATTAVALFAAVAAVAVGGLLATGAGHSTTPGRPEGGTVEQAPAMELAAAVTASQSTSYKLAAMTGTPDDPDAWGKGQGAWDPATSTGYYTGVAKGGKGYDYQRFINGTQYAALSGTKWEQIQLPNNGLQYGSPMDGTAGGSANPDDLFAALREKRATVTRTGARTYHFVSTKKYDHPGRGSWTLTGDVTLDSKGWVAQVNWQTTSEMHAHGVNGDVDDSLTGVGTVTFSDYGTPVHVAKPTADEVAP